MVLIQEQSNDRKLQMQAKDRARQKNEKLNDLDEEARQKAEYLLQKAKEQQEEQEDEIKHLNEVRQTKWHGGSLRAVIHGISLGDNTIMLNTLFCLITISRTFSSYLDIGKSQFKKLRLCVDSEIPWKN